MKSSECVVNMIRFTYSAYDSEGIKVAGEIEALGMREAQEQLRFRDLLIISIKQKVNRDNELDFLARRRVSKKELEFLTSELALLLKAGVTIDRALSVLQKSSSSPQQLKLVSSLYNSVRNGDSLSDAMRQEQEAFSPLYVNLVKLGETTGSLARVFSRLAEDIKFQSELRAKIIQALTYPFVVFSVCIVCVAFIFNYIVPQMSSLFDGVADIPLYTRVLLGLSTWMINYQWFVVLSLILAAVGIFTMYRAPGGSEMIDELVLSLPGAGSFIILVERIRFNTAISMMLDSGVLIDNCLELALGSIKSDSIKSGLEIAKDRVKKGTTLAEALGSSPLYPDFCVSLIDVGEESGELGPVFTELSARSRREFELWIERFTALLEPLLILIMGGIVGVVVVVMLLSIVSTSDIGF